MLSIKNWVKITPHEAFINGHKVFALEDNILSAIYRSELKDYPKFFKMDTLSKLGFIASELLLKDEIDRFQAREDRAIVLFNKSASFVSDSHYQQTISNPDDYFPSPSVFVYTLANIVTGEIAIRNKYYGETSFYVTNGFNVEEIVNLTSEVFCDESTQSAISGYVECSDNKEFTACLFLVEAKPGDKQWNIETINRLWKNLY